MNKFILLLSCLCLSVSLSAETVYKKTNPDGSVEFTDINSSDSKEIKVREPTTYKAPRLPSLRPVHKRQPRKVNYALSITQPSNDVIITGQLNVTVTVSLQPGLRTGYGHRIQYQVAGQSRLSTQLTEAFTNVSRGSHVVSVSVVDGNSEVVSPVATSAFHMKRFFKKKVVKPKPKPPY